MNFEVGMIIQLKKAHPCGSSQWEILRVGADFRLKCTGCGRLLHMSDEASRAISGSLLDTSGFRLDVGRTTLFGLCRSCTENAENGRKGNLTI